VSKHACAIPGCFVMVDSGLLMCPAHWRRVPKPVQRAVWNTWRNGPSGAYLAARESAIRCITKPGGGK